MDITGRYLPVPGRTTDFKSAGCNWLIRNHQAILLENVQDLVRMMGWEEKRRLQKKSRENYLIELSELEQRIMELLKEREQMHIDVINATTGFPNSLNAGPYWNWK